MACGGSGEQPSCDLRLIPNAWAHHWDGTDWRCNLCGVKAQVDDASCRLPPNTRLPDAFGDLMSVTGPFDGPAPWERASVGLVEGTQGGEK